MLNVKVETKELKKLVRKGYSIAEYVEHGESRISIYNGCGDTVVELVYNDSTNDIFVMDRDNFYCFDFVEICISGPQNESVGIRGSLFDKPYQQSILHFN